MRIIQVSDVYVEEEVKFEDGSVAAVLHPLVLHKDNRGVFSEVLRGDRLPEGLRDFGQLSFLTCGPGYERGGHWHERKVEWFLVLQGIGYMDFAQVVNGKVQERSIRVHLEGGHPVLVEVRPRACHWIGNRYSTMLTVVVYCNEPYVEADPDTWRA